MRLIKAIGISTGIVGCFILMLQIIIWWATTDSLVRNVSGSIVAFVALVAIVYWILDSEDNDDDEEWYGDQE